MQKEEILRSKNEKKQVKVSGKVTLVGDLKRVQSREGTVRGGGHFS